MNDPEKPLQEDISYVLGYVESVKALVLALAQNVPKETFRQSGLQRFDSLRTVLNAEPVPEARLIAVDHIEAWLKKVTD